MKGLFALALAAAIVGCMTAGCSTGAQLKGGEASFVEAENGADGIKSNGSDVRDFHYGSFNDCTVSFVPGNCDAVSKFEVCGYTFLNASTFAIEVERNGEVCELKKAYEKGWLSEKDIAQIYEIHKKNEIEHFNAEELYKEFE